MQYIHLLLLAVAAFAAEPAPTWFNAGGPAETDLVFESVTPEIVTPHLTFGKPLPGGTVKVLVLAPAWGQRETVELAQRFDVAPSAVMTHTHTAFGGLTGPYLGPDKVAARMDAALAAEPDVIVIGGFDWAGLLLEHRTGILRHVHDGGGLVYVSPPPDDELAQLWVQPLVDGAASTVAGELPWELLTALAGKTREEVVTGGTFGAGRWLRLSYPTHSTNQSLTPRITPAPPRWEYDLYQDLLGRAVLWTIERSPPPLAESPADTWLVQRRSDSATVASGTGDWRAGLPAAGGYLVHYRQHDPAGNVVAWRTFPGEVERGIAITGLTCERDNYTAGEPMPVTITTNRPLQPTERLRVRLETNRGAVLREIDPAGPALTVAGVEPGEGNIHRFVAEVLADDNVLARRATDLSIRGRRPPAFHLAIWEEPETDYISSLWYQRYRDVGVDAVFYNAQRGQRDAAARLIAAAGLWGAPSIPMYNPRRIEQSEAGPVHPVSLFSDEFRRQARDQALASATPFAPYDVLFYPTGSDVSMHGNSFDPTTLTAFREWLGQRYPSVAALNEAWVTQWDSFGEVIPLSFAKAKAADRFESWVEHTRFMEQGFANHQLVLTEALKTFDPEPLFGEDGFGRLQSDEGADWVNLLANSGFVNLYTYQDPPQMEILRSLFPKYPNVKLRSLYFGSYDGQFGNYAFFRRLPWEAVLNGYNGLFWWVANGKTTYGGWPQGMFAPDFRETRSFATARREIDRIRGGIAELIANAERHHDGVAIYYDQTVVHAVTAYEHPSELVRSLTSWQTLCEDVGLQYDYVIRQDLLDGLLGQGYRLLVLSHALAMDDATAAALNAFVAAGGKVLADVPPARYDELLRPAPDRLTAVMLQPELADYARLRQEAERVAARETWLATIDGCVEPAVVLDDGDQQIGVPGVRVIEHRLGDDRLVGLVNRGSAVELTVRLSAARRVSDAVSGQAVALTDGWPVALEGGETRLFRVEK